MNPATLLCPQCGSPLPRQALWRTVTCSYCSADVTRAVDVVSAARFHDAWLRSRGDEPAALTCAGQRYRAIAHLGSGTHATVMLAERLGAIAERVVLKIAHATTPPGHLQQEKDVLDRLQADTGSGSAYFSQRLPQAIALGSGAGVSGDTCQMLVLRHPTGYWGSLADVRQNYPQGVSARHAVWMWRRVLEVLDHVHERGWAHGRLAPEHLLVQPRDHGVLMIGWAGACRSGRHLQTRDLMQSAWAMRAMLGNTDFKAAIMPSTPCPLAALLQRASEDSAWCGAINARELDQALVSAAREAFGPSQFVHFSPTASTT